MMNVKLPNGQIVKNVPDGTTKEELREKLNNSSIVSSWENNQSTFTGEKIDVAIAVKAKGNDPIIPGSTRTLPSGETVSLTEIDDSESTIIRGNNFIKYLTDNKFRDYATEEGTNSAWTYSSVADVLKHDKLYNARPEYKNIPVEVKRKSDHKAENGGEAWAYFEYHPLNNQLDKIVIYAEDSKGNQITKSEDAIHRTLLHELQHKGEFDIEYYNKNGIAVSNSYSSDHNLQVSTEDRVNMTEEERQKSPMDMSWLPQTIKDETAYDYESEEWVTVTGGKEIDNKEPYNKMMSSVYRWEGGYQQIKKDSGNYTTSGKLIGTNKGISAKTLETYLGREPTVDDMKNLDQKTISTIYKEEFYKRYKIYKLPKELQTVAMHALVTGGPKTIKYLQELAGTKQDMLIGDETIKAIKDKGITAEQLKNKILSNYKEFDSWKDFGNGWTNRFNDII